MAAWLVALPVAAFVLIGAVVHLDWNFLLQKLTVLLVWLAAIAIVHGLSRSAEGFAPHQPAGTPFAERGAKSSAERRAPVGQHAVLAPVIALGGCALVSLALSRAQPQAGRALDVESALDRYAAVDPSYRLIRDAWTVPSGETARFYAHLHANTLVPPAEARPAPVDFVTPLRAAPDRSRSSFCSSSTVFGATMCRPTILPSPSRRRSRALPATAPCSIARLRATQARHSRCRRSGPAA